MTRRHVLREIALWVPVGAIPIINGALRMLLYAHWLGEPRASLQRAFQAVDLDQVDADGERHDDSPT